MKSRGGSGSREKVKLRWSQLFDEVRGSSERTDPDYEEHVIDRAVENYYKLEPRFRETFVGSFDTLDRKRIRERLTIIESIKEATPEELVSRRVEPQLGGVIDEINRELIAALKKHPDWVYQLNPRAFEKLVAEIFKDMGCDVELTPQSRDGGRDVLAHFNSPIGRMLTIIECKRYAADRKVGLDIVERFLFTVKDRDRANAGLIATTSSFTSEAMATAHQYKYLLQLRDFSGVRDWIGKYGTWVPDKSSQLWVPHKTVVG